MQENPSKLRSRTNQPDETALGCNFRGGELKKTCLKTSVGAGTMSRTNAFLITGPAVKLQLTQTQEQKERAATLLLASDSPAAFVRSCLVKKRDQELAVVDLYMANSQSRCRENVSCLSCLDRAQAVAVDGPALCRMFNQAIAGQGLPTRLSTDHDPLFRFQRWQANLRILDVETVQTVPQVRRP
jgi:hypothetical protein